jgi:ribose-phosphate pyrophosphokinase
MRTLNLAHADKGDIPYKVIAFSDSQKLINLDGIYAKGNTNIEKSVQITSRMTWEDVQLIICAKKALEEAGFKEIHLYVPYFLGARSDRKFQNGSINYLKHLICPIINNLQFKSVTVYDPHSFCLEMGLENFKCINSSNLIRHFLEQEKSNLKNAMWLIPDKGASAKAKELIIDSNYDDQLGEVVVCDKIRDIPTGKIIKTVVPVMEFHGRDAFIVDDICDGGGTFIEIAKVCKQHNVGNMYLVVSHGIFSKGLGELAQYFQGIYCTNSINDLSKGDSINVNNKDGKLLVKQLPIV